MNRTSVSESHTVKPTPELIKLIKDTAPMREQAVYWAGLREWAELPLWKRLFTKKPTPPLFNKDGE